MSLRKFARFTILFGKAGAPQCRLLPPAFPKAAVPLPTHFRPFGVTRMPIVYGFMT
jgi:hypothetical protein